MQILTACKFNAKTSNAIIIYLVQFTILDCLLNIKNLCMHIQPRFTIEFSQSVALGHENQVKVDIIEVVLYMYVYIKTHVHLFDYIVKKTSQHVFERCNECGAASNALCSLYLSIYMCIINIICAYALLWHHLELSQFMLFKIDDIASLK